MIYRLFSLVQLIALLCVSASSFAQVDKKHAGAVPAQDFYKRYTLLSADPSNLEMVPDPAGSGKTVLKARVRNTDEKVRGGIRTEILPTSDYTRAGVARWYAVSVYFPGDWEFHPTPVIVSQLHTSQKKAILQPPVALIAYGNNLNLELHFNYRVIEGDDATTKQNSAAQMIRLDRIKTEQWYCFVMYVDWSHTPGKGAFRLWMNGDKLYEKLNSPNSYPSEGGNYPKAGLYLPGTMMAREQSIYLDFIHTGGPKTSYAEMAALTPCSK